MSVKVPRGFETCSPFRSNTTLVRLWLSEYARSGKQGKVNKSGSDAACNLKWKVLCGKQVLCRERGISGHRRHVPDRRLLHFATILPARSIYAAPLDFVFHALPLMLIISTSEIAQYQI